MIESSIFKRYNFLFYFEVYTTQNDRLKKLSIFTFYYFKKVLLCTDWVKQSNSTALVWSQNGHLDCQSADALPTTAPNITCKSNNLAHQNVYFIVPVEVRPICIKETGLETSRSAKVLSLVNGFFLQKNIFPASEWAYQNEIFHRELYIKTLRDSHIHLRISIRSLLLL